MDEFSKDGQALLDEEEYAEAEQVFRDALATDLQPQDRFFALQGLGDALYYQNNEEEAIACFKEAFDIAPNEEKKCGIHQDLAYAYFDLKQYEDAAREFEDYLSLISDKTNTGRELQLLGESHFELGNKKEALSYLERALLADLAEEHRVYALLLSGILLREQNELPEALERFKLAYPMINDTTDKMEAFVEMLNIFLQLGQIQDAMQLMSSPPDVSDMPLEKEDKEIIKHYFLASHQVATGRLVDAKQTLGQLLPIIPDEEFKCILLNLRGFVNLMMRNLGEAEDDFYYIFKSDFKELKKDAEFLLALIQLWRGNRSAILNTLNQKLNIDPSVEGLTEAYAKAETTDDNRELLLNAVGLNAISAFFNEDFKKVISVAPLALKSIDIKWSGILIYAYSVSLIVNNRASEALLFLEQQGNEAKQIFGLDHLIRGIAFAHLKGKLDDAIAEFNESIKDFPDMITSYYFLGLAYFRLHKFPEAIELLTMLLDKYDYDPDGSTSYLLAEALSEAGEHEEAEKYSERFKRTKSSFVEDLRKLKIKLNQRYLDSFDSGDDFIVMAPASMLIRRKLARVAETKATVYLAGETGVGKEKWARFIHDHSPRWDKKFVAVNFGELNESTMISELFGYKKGAFTGAHANHDGRLKEAQDGTLFLDEILDLSAKAQAMLLRALQEKKIRPMGGKEEEEVDFRLICASNKNIDDEVSSGRFREDLMYRIKINYTEIPPLRERTEEIEKLFKLFLAKACKDSSRELPMVSKQVISTIMSHPWPGNVRELEGQAIAIASTLEPGKDEVELSDLDIKTDRQKHLAQQPTGNTILTPDEQRYYNALKAANFVKKDAAAILGVGPSAITEFLKDHPNLKAIVEKETPPRSRRRSRRNPPSTSIH